MSSNVNSKIESGFKDQNQKLGMINDDTNYRFLHICGEIADFSTYSITEI